MTQANTNGDRQLENIIRQVVFRVAKTKTPDGVQYEDLSDSAAAQLYGGPDEMMESFVAQRIGLVESALRRYAQGAAGGKRDFPGTDVQVTGMLANLLDSTTLALSGGDEAIEDFVRLGMESAEDMLRAIARRAMIAGSPYYRVVEGEEGDGKTCSRCGGMDGRVYATEDYEPGVSAPPFHPNCRGYVEAVSEEEILAAIKESLEYNEGKRSYRDEESDWVAGVIGEFFGMRYDRERKLIYFSKEGGFQKSLGYYDLYDILSLLLQFHLIDAKTVAGFGGAHENQKTFKVSDLMDILGWPGLMEDNAGGETNVVTHRVWMGNYSGFTLLDHITLSGLGADKNYFGGESGILINNEYLSEDEFGQTIRIYDRNGNEILHFDSSEYFENPGSDWVYACTYTDQAPAKMTGTITHDSEYYLRLIAEGNIEGNITYKTPYLGNDGKWVLEWIWEA